MGHSGEGSRRVSAGTLHGRYYFACVPGLGKRAQARRMAGLNGGPQAERCIPI
jgi:hypothetical protein